MTIINVFQVILFLINVIHFFCIIYNLLFTHIFKTLMQSNSSNINSLRTENYLCMIYISAIIHWQYVLTFTNVYTTVRHSFFLYSCGFGKIHVWYLALILNCTLIKLPIMKLIWIHNWDLKFVDWFHSVLFL